MDARALAPLLLPVWLGASAAGAASCLADAGTRERASAARTRYGFEAPGHAVDARGVVWRGPRGHALKLSGRHPACFAGGRLEGPYPEDAVYECEPAHCPRGVCPQPCWAYHVSAGVSVRGTAPAVIEDVFVSDYGDGISQEEQAARARLEIRRAHLRDLHDDAVENDWGASVTVLDSLLERVNVAFASRPRRSRNVDARRARFEVRDSLVRLHRFTHQYKQRPGHGGFWKWAHGGRGPRIAVTGNVFLAETETNGLLLPPLDHLVECRDNVLLWAGTRAAWRRELAGDREDDGLDNRGRLEALAHCWRVVLRSEAQTRAAFLAEHWDPLVRGWLERHAASAARGPAYPAGGAAEGR